MHTRPCAPETFPETPRSKEGNGELGLHAPARRSQGRKTPGQSDAAADVLSLSPLPAPPYCTNMWFVSSTFRHFLRRIRSQCSRNRSARSQGTPRGPETPGTNPGFARLASPLSPRASDAAWHSASPAGAPSPGPCTSPAALPRSHPPAPARPAPDTTGQAAAPQAPEAG